MLKANELAPLLKVNKDEAVRKLLKFAVTHWEALSEEARKEFSKEFPQMAISFEGLFFLIDVCFSLQITLKSDYV